MLEPGVIPKKEPDISVGIILPEDNYTSIDVIVPQDRDYQIEFMGRTIQLGSGAELLFKLKGSSITILIDGQEKKSESPIKIYPVVDSPEPDPSVDLILKNVISGRSFHWKKYLNVRLPGTLVVKPFNNQLIAINELPIETYFMCVATSEMGAECPPALIEAQTIIARSWMLANVEQKHRSLGIDVCNDDCCQRYQGSTHLTEHSINGALKTYGQVLLHNDAICDARYSKSCGGMMEAFENVWPGE
ncbi:MAG: SpoIID/LytB domain-containing protein, partial [Caldithrix sp.]|nr:SpoIID/LytB domain-containing protein [Caldithrix sp.]